MVAVSSGAEVEDVGDVLAVDGCVLWAMVEDNAACLESTAACFGLA
jgi:hypothetical protein